MIAAGSAASVMATTRSPGSNFGSASAAGVPGSAGFRSDRFRAAISVRLDGGVMPSCGNRCPSSRCGDT